MPDDGGGLADHGRRGWGFVRGTDVPNATLRNDSGWGLGRNGGEK